MNDSVRSAILDKLASLQYKYNAETELLQQECKDRDQIVERFEDSIARLITVTNELKKEIDELNIFLEGGKL